MIGMNFMPFLALLIIGAFSSLVLYMVVRYRVLPGFDGFMSMWIAGWAGAWLGSPVFGRWGAHVGNVFIIPALLGAFAGPFLVTAVFRALGRSFAVAQRPDAVPSQAGGATQFEMRKAS